MKYDSIYEYSGLLINQRHSYPFIDNIPVTNVSAILLGDYYIPHFDTLIEI